MGVVSTRAILPLGALALLAAALAIAGDAEAATAASTSTCSHVAISIPTGTRAFSIADTSESGPTILTCNSGAFALRQIPAGESIQLTCTEVTQGASPPGVPDTNGIVLRAFADNAAFPASPGTPGFWSRTFSSCFTPRAVAFWCTSDGTATGAPRHGPVRIYVSATRTSIPTYNDDSDHGSQGTNIATYGILLCKAKQTGLTLSPEQAFYPGGTSVTQTLTLASSAYTNVNVGQLRVKCGSPWDGRSGMTGGFGSGSTVTLAGTITPSSWPQGCSSIRLNASITAHSSLAGYTSLPYTVFDASSTDAPSNATQSWTDPNQGTHVVGPTDVEKIAPGTVSYVGTFDGVNMTKCAEGAPTCGNVSSFIISADTAYAQPWGLRDSNGAIVSGVTVSCTHLRPDGSTLATVAMGATNATGTAPIQPFAVDPPRGTWSLNCTASWSGNAASYLVRFGYASAYTADTAFAVKWNVRFEPSNGTLLANVTALLRTYNATSNELAPVASDAPPRCTLVAYDPTTGAYSRALVPPIAMTSSNASAGTYWCLAWLAPGDAMDAFALVHANLSGAPFVGHAGYSLPHAAGALDILGDATVLGTLNAARLSGEYDISQANGMIETSFDPYVQPLVYGGITLASTVVSLWVARQRGILPKLAIGILLVMVAIWASTTTVTSDADAFRWIAVVITSGWTLIVLYSMKGQGVTR